MLQRNSCQSKRLPRKSSTEIPVIKADNVLINIPKSSLILNKFPQWHLHRRPANFD
jgi:hypothetical protein